MKKLLFTILFVLTVFAASAQNSDEQYIDGVRYELCYTNGVPTHVAVKGELDGTPAYDYNIWSNNPPTTVEIPETVEFNGYDYPVTTIGMSAFNDIGSNGFSIDFVLPKTITSIGYAAFDPSNYTALSPTPVHTLEIKAMVAPAYDEQFSADYFKEIIVPDYSIGYDVLGKPYKRSGQLFYS